MPALSKEELDLLLPHGRGMSLLDSVRHWEPSHIHCTTRSHLAHSNPLRSSDGLLSICGLEYAAQAMALHINLLRASPGSRHIAGYIGGIKDLRIGVGRLDSIEADLEIEATQLIDTGSSLIYSFSVRAQASVLLQGRASLFLHLASDSL